MAKERGREYETDMVDVRVEIEETKARVRARENEMS